MSINLADGLVNKQLVILLIFVNKHFVNAVTMGKVSHVDKMRMQTMREQGFEAKAIIREYTRTNNGNKLWCEAQQTPPPAATYE